MKTSTKAYLTLAAVAGIVITITHYLPNSYIKG